MAQMNYAALVGVNVDLSGEVGPFRVCRHCAAETGRIGAGSGPHVASLVCVNCERHIAWLGAAHLDAMVAAQGAGRVA